MNYNSYLSQIIAFNSDKDVVVLREKFNRPSFFEIISKARSKTTYSAFLKWLFQENSHENNLCGPVSYLLDVLVRRSEEQKDYTHTILENAEVKRSIVTRKLSIESIKVETEKPISVLAQGILNDTPRYIGVLDDGKMKKIAAKSQDCVDLLIECSIIAKDVSAKSLQIIIENKIDSPEGGKKAKNTIGVPEYDNASQTTRYYLGTKFSTFVSGYPNNDGKTVDGKDTLQLYVYLTPNEPSSDTGIDDHYIQISYQDIVDGILLPMLSSSSLSSRNRFFIEEFLNQLVYPNLDGTIMYPSIAVGKEHSKAFSGIWNKYQTLLTDCAIAAAESNLWKVGDTYYDHQPRTEVLSILLQKNVNDECIENGQWKKNTRFSKIQEVAKSHLGMEVAEVSLGVDESCQNLLSSFWDENRRFLTAVINGMDEQERTKVKALLTEVSKRDTTKYNVYYDDKLLNRNPLCNAETAMCIVKKWILLQNGGVTLDDLRKSFPRSYNPYYENGKWYKHLFYPKNACVYDGEKGDGSKPTSNWDIDFNGKYDLQTKDGEVVFLKMWRKDGLEHLIKKVEEAKLFPEGTLNIVPVE